MPEAELVSLIRLIQVPEKYHGARVRVVGYARIEFEHRALYVSRDDLRHAVTKNSVWLDTPVTEELKALDRKCLLVEATFDKERLGHLRMCSGTLTAVTRAEVWSEGRDPEKEPPKG